MQEGTGHTWVWKAMDDRVQNRTCGSNGERNGYPKQLESIEFQQDEDLIEVHGDDFGMPDGGIQDGFQPDFGIFHHEIESGEEDEGVKDL